MIRSADTIVAHVMVKIRNDVGFVINREVSRLVDTYLS